MSKDKAGLRQIGAWFDKQLIESMEELARANYRTLTDEICFAMRRHLRYPPPSSPLPPLGDDVQPPPKKKRGRPKKIKE